MRLSHLKFAFLFLVLIPVLLPLPVTAQEEKKKKSSSPKSLKQVLDWLGSDKGKKRRKARRFLLKHTTPKDVAILFKKVQETKSKRVGKALIEVIRRLRTRKAGNALLKLTKHDVLSLRVAALSALIQLKDPRARKLFVHRLTSDEVSTKEKRYMLDQTKYHLKSKLRKVLRELLKKDQVKKDSLKVAILDTLLTRKRMANKSIFDSLFKSENEKLKVRAAFGLYQLGLSRSLSYLKEQFVAGNVPGHVTRKLLRIVEKRKEKSFRPVLLNALAENPKKISVKISRVFEVLGKIAKSDDIERIRELQKKFEGKKELNQKINKAIANIASRTDIEMLIELLNSDKPPSARVDTAVFLFRMDHSQGMDAIVTYLSESDPTLRNKACLALAEQGVHIYRTIPVLLDLLNDSDNTVRTNAYRALKQQILAYFPYHPFDFSKINYKPDLPESKRTAEIKKIRDWWKKFGGEKEISKRNKKTDDPKSHEETK